MRILAVLGEGGHTKEMVRLVELLGEGYEFGYVLVADDDLSEKKITVPGPVFRVIRPRDKAHNLPNDVRKFLVCAWQAWRAVRQFRPQAMISTGPSVAVPVALVCKLARVKVIFVETGSRVTALSTTGRIMYRLADLFLVQWEPLAEMYPKAVYAGRLC
ncbi:MAG: PssD/Cps14F family polysaccharide biosynthesis glycosyltransferase [Anaerolineae bacterium]|jgi:UDP-N-acetylglucosamine:LPS N-acetylglucosamine transferase|nr:PssD/Cps14F family polysaccharide biosynthesis glycosyltransferase [Anaerolineae bacterium]